MGYFDGWWGDDYLDTWFDPAVSGVTPPASGHGGVSNSLALAALAPKPKPPIWRQIPGAIGSALTEVRQFLHEALAREQLWGNHVVVTFAAPNTATRVQTGLGSSSVKGYKVVKSSADLTVFDATSSTPVTERGVIYLQSSAAGTVTLYVY